MIALISIFATITGTLVLHRNYRSKQSGLLFLRSKKGNTSPISIFLSNKILGFIIIGLIPGIIVFATLPSGTSMPGLSFEYNWDYWYLLGLPVLITGINYFLAKNPNIMKSYPEMRFAEWNKTRLAVLVLGWTIYLSAYEFLFRGILFFSIYQSSGLLVSLIVNVVVYSATHYAKGKAEMAGAIPFGILLCYASLLTGSFILPFLIHLSLALSTAFFSIHNNPEMKIVRL